MCRNCPNYYNSNITYLSRALQFRYCKECYLITWLILNYFQITETTSNIISDLLDIKNIVMIMGDASGGVGQGGSNTSGTASGSVQIMHLLLLPLLPPPHYLEVFLICILILILCLPLMQAMCINQYTSEQ